MLLPAAVAAGLLVALAGLACVRTAPPAARWLAMLVALAFAVVAGLSDRTATRRIEPQPQQVGLDGDEVARRTAMLRAAARAGPRVHELELRWERAPIANGRAPTAALGARARLPDAMPFAPEDVRLRAAARAEVDRPTLLEVEVDGLADDVPAELVVRDRGGEVLRQQVVVGPRPATVAFTPVRAGRYEVSLRVAAGAHRVTATGGFDATLPAEILVVEPTGVVAAALRAQGERVREARGLPSDWRRHQRIVLGRDLPVAQQEELGAAVHDGIGLFVLGIAFGGAGAPLRELLPVRVLPEQPEPTERDGVGGGAGPEPADPQPPPVPADPEPKPPEPIAGTEGAGPISKDPVEVDKHTIAMILVVDRSGSMGDALPDGFTAMSYAKTSALRTAQALSEGDRVGLVTFGDKGAGKVELPLTDATRRDEIAAGIERLAHRRGEMTYLLAGLEQAQAQLQAAPEAVKHVVVVTDGMFMVTEDLALTRIAHRMREQSRATLSIIAINAQNSPSKFKELARTVATTGGGTYFEAPVASGVPKLVSAEVARALSRVGREPNTPGDERGEPPPRTPEPTPPPEQPEPADEPDPEPAAEPPRALPVIAVCESELLQPTPVEWPTLGAAVACEAPLDSTVLLVVGEQGWPLLTFANRGLGRVGAFAADLGGEAGRAFREAEEFPAWLSQWLAATAAAERTAQPEDLRAGGEVSPPAPVPADVRHLRALTGGPPLAADEPALALQPVVGSEVVEQVSRLAPLLLPLLLLLALAERWLGARALRRGQS